MEEEINNYFGTILDIAIKENQEKNEKWRKEVVPGLKLIFAIMVISNIVAAILLCWP